MATVVGAGRPRRWHSPTTSASTIAAGSSFLLRLRGAAYMVTLIHVLDGPINGSPSLIVSGTRSRNRPRRPARSSLRAWTTSSHRPLSSRLGFTVRSTAGDLMWSSQHLNRCVVRKQWRCWDGRNAYSRCAADARRTTGCTSADQCRSEFRTSGGGRQVFDEDRAETTEHGGRHATAEADAFEAAPVIGGARGSLERIRRRRIVSCDRTAPWTGTVHHRSRGQRP